MIFLEVSSKVGGVMVFCFGMLWGVVYLVGVSIGGIMEELESCLMVMLLLVVEFWLCMFENFGVEI